MEFNKIILIGEHIHIQWRDRENLEVRNVRRMHGTRYHVTEDRYDYKDTQTRASIKQAETRDRESEIDGEREGR